MLTIFIKNYTIIDDLLPMYMNTSGNQSVDIFKIVILDKKK